MNYKTNIPTYQPSQPQYPTTTPAPTYSNLHESPPKYSDPSNNNPKNPESYLRLSSSSNALKMRSSFEVSQFPTIPIKREVSGSNSETRLEFTHSNSSTNVMGLGAGQEQKLKFREVTEDLAKLKRKLQGIIISNNENRSQVQNRNRSADKIYSPYYRMDDIKSFAKSGHENQQAVKIDLKIRDEKDEKPQSRRLATEPYANYYTSRSNSSQQDNQSTYSNSPSYPKYGENYSSMETKAKSPPSSYSYRSNNQQIDQEKIDLQTRIDNLSKQNQQLLTEKQKLKQLLTTQKSLNSSLQQKYNQICQQYEQCQTREQQLRQQVYNLELQCRSHRKGSGNGLSHRQKNNFEEVLKQQLQETQKIKQVVEEKNEQIAKLNEIVTYHRRSTESAINDSTIEKLKYQTEKKQMQQLHQISLLHKENQVKTLKHALETLDLKLQVAIRDNRTKDQFLQNHLIGRLKTGEEKEYVNRVLEKYQYEFPSSRVKDKLMEEQAEIQRLRALLKERGIEVEKTN